MSHLAFTYANDILMDGAGAQLQKMYSIYALSRFLDVSYVHSPLAAISYHGLASVENNSGLPAITERYNAIFKIPSDFEPPVSAIVSTLPIADLHSLCRIKDHAKQSDEFHLVRIMSSHLITNKHPQMLQYAQALSPFIAKSSPVFRLAIHVRRGDLLIFDSARMLPNAYYITTALKIINILRKLDISFVCELYTELASKTFLVTSGHYGIGSRLQEPVAMDPEECHIREFEVLPNLQKFINTDPIEALTSLATADLLIMSRSAFSYLPAVLNKKGIIVYVPFYSNPLPEWIDATQQDSFEDKIMESCECWKATR